MAPVEGYDYRFFSFDNETGEERPLGASLRVTEPILPLPTSDLPYLLVRIRTVTDSFPRWKKAVDVYLRGSRVVGIDREL